MYSEQTNAHLIDSSLYCSLFTVPTRFNANSSSSGSSHSVPERVRAVSVHQDCMNTFM